MFISVPTDNLSIGPAWARPPAEWLEELGKVPASIAGDVLGRMSTLDEGIQVRTAKDCLIGYALPVHVRSGDNLAIHRALDEAQSGDVLVINGEGDTSRALLGDLLGEIMVQKGVRGAVVDGAVRDVKELSEQNLSIYSRGVTPSGPFKTGPGTVGYAVAVGGAVVSPGDLIIGDSDGVVVVPVSKIEHLSREYQTAVDAENALRARIRTINTHS